MYNKVVLVGHLTRDVEVRYTQSGSAIGNVGIATNRTWKSQTGEQKSETMFIDLTFFGRTAEIANQYLRKGSKVLVDGRLVFEQWTTQDGSKRSKHAVIVESMKMMDTKAEGQALAQGQQSSEYTNQPSQNSYGTKQEPKQNSYGSSNSVSGYENSNSGYNPHPQQQQQPSYSQPQQQSYVQPQQAGYGTQPVSQQPSYTQPQQPVQQSVPEIDIDEDEIPF
jgi:single-strand DNA-binding protein